MKPGHIKPLACHALLIATAISACTASRLSATLQTSAAGPSLPPPRPSNGSFVGGLADLHLSLRAPAHIAYDPASLGVAGQFVAIGAQNVSAYSVSVAHLHASFAATREGVAFGCNTHAAAPPGRVEPSELRPSQSYTFERLLDCAMPLPGPYDVRVWIHTSSGAEEQGVPNSSAYVGSFQVDVTADKDRAPRAVPSHQGLYALMIGAPVAAPLARGKWEKGVYRVVVALINGADRPVAIGPAHVTLLMFKQGATLACAGRREPLDAPSSLAPGATYIARVPVTCAPDTEGRYEIAGKLAIGANAEVEMGRFGLLVTRREDLVIVPEWPRQWPPEWPSSPVPAAPTP